jgi:aryl-alcohol dehydrogenase-like predicted oxidoreductase
MNAVEDSLRRLNTDRIDLYFLHRFDATTPLEESLRALDDLVKQGKVLYLGASNFAAWQIAKGLGLSALHGLAFFQCIQPMYNLVKRQAEVEILPMAQAENLGVTPYSPLGGGLLSGKYASGKAPDTGRLIENEMYQIRYGEGWVQEAARRFSEFANERGYDPVSLAIAWVGGHPAVTAPIIGARNVEQLEGSLASLDIEMTAELWNEIAALTPEPPPATDRSEERGEVHYGIRK